MLQTGIPDIYAAGDVAVVKDPRTGIYEAHSHWTDAEREGMRVGHLLAGREPTAQSTLRATWHSTTLGGKASLLAIGDTLGTTPGAESWTEKRKGTYRRITVLHDQVIGYLSLGERMPDPAAITYVIDEGLSLSAIQEVLLGKHTDNGESERGRPTWPLPSSMPPALSDNRMHQGLQGPENNEEPVIRKLS